MSKLIKIKLDPVLVIFGIAALAVFLLTAAGGCNPHVWSIIGHSGDNLIKNLSGW
jgi:hypothetical protein